MPFSDDISSARVTDSDRLRDFGPPVFTLAPQLRVTERGFSWYGFSDRVARLHFWLADPSGNFWFEDTPLGRMGVAELKGFVFTDVPGAAGSGASAASRGEGGGAGSGSGTSAAPGATDRDATAVAAVRHYLADAIDYYSADPLEDLSSGRSEHHRRELAKRSPGQDSLSVDGRPHPAVVLDYGDYVARSAWVGDRLATLVLRSRDLRFVDARLVTRPAD
ncbi:hypothetical protein [Planctomonas deserti]|uniref:hypothetical protein n=1 Tax=Planctomonas deserti TaxID=2144185 RepID=UPI000D3D0700|nr:hypothetical protein [Planctomonas deserti]